MSELEWVTPDIELRAPVMVLALEGLFDAAEAATNALTWLQTNRPVETVAAVDPDGFFDFATNRPTVSIVDGRRLLGWQQNEFVALRDSAAQHDLVVLHGIEPDVRWKTFVDLVVEVIERTGCEFVATVGAFPEPVPHTRTPFVFGSTSNSALAARLGLSRPQYQGPTGIVGVLTQRLDSMGLPTVALRVGVPHYLTNARHPRSTLALLRHLEHVLGFPTHHELLEDEVQQWQALHDRAVGSDAQAEAFVRMLEDEFDRRAEAMVTSGEDLGRAFEEFLREHRGDGDAEDPEDP